MSILWPLACYGVLMRHNPSLFEAALRKFIVDKCGIAPIRVNSIEVGQHISNL